MEKMLADYYGIEEEYFIDFFKARLQDRISNDDSFGQDMLYLLEHGSAVELFFYLVNCESFEEFLVEIS